jgi:hypothetical protein
VRRHAELSLWDRLAQISLASSRAISISQSRARCDRQSYIAFGMLTVDETGGFLMIKLLLLEDHLPLLVFSSSFRPFRNQTTALGLV